MTQRVQVWQCIGCGRIEAPQPCIGVCQDQKVELVSAFEHDFALSHLALARRQIGTLEALIRQLAWTTPHDHKWEPSYQALQDKARRILAALPRGEPKLGQSAVCGDPALAA